MFTGLVESVGRVASVRDENGARRLRISTPADLSAGLRTGDSVAVNGVCLTADHITADAFEATAVAETLARTTVGAFAPGDPVNLETAAAAARGLGGHIVQGHVDGVARVTGWEAGPDGGTLRLALPADVYELCVKKGSIAIDGVSLTVAAMEEDGIIALAIVPHTRSNTIIETYRPGMVVNVEADVIAKYVHAFVRRALAAGNTPR
jgi:riboflavin synthase